jgi:hypothetical protein
MLTVSKKELVDRIREKTGGKLETIKTVTRADHQGEDEFYCEAYQPK